MTGIDLLDDDGLLDLRPRARVTDPAAVVAEERRRGREAGGEGPQPTDPPASHEAHQPAGTSATDLRAFAARPEPAQDGTKCHICRAKAARYKCKSCGKGMCAGHAWVMFGLCQSCATEERMARWRRGARADDRNWLEGG